MAVSRMASRRSLLGGTWSITLMVSASHVKCAPEVLSSNANSAGVHKPSDSAGNRR